MMAVRGALCLVSLALVLRMPQSSAQRCAPIVWSSEHGTNPIQQHQGKIVLVSLMKGYCGYCIHQAQLLQSLYSQRTQAGMYDLEMIIVNGGEEASASRVNNLRNVVSFTVLQDTPDHYLYRDVFQGYKDDTIIFDRCGQRTYRIPYPYSNLAANYTEILLRRTHNGMHHCYCSRDYAQQQQTFERRKRSIHMTNEDTDGVSAVEAAANRFNFMNCSDTDVVCQRFRNIFNQMNRRGQDGTNGNGLQTRLGMFVDGSDFSLDNAGSSHPFNARSGRSGIRYRMRNRMSRSHGRGRIFK